MPRSTLLSRIGHGTGVLAVVAGALGTLYLLGAFGVVSRWESVSSDGTVTTGGSSGVDYLLGTTTGNAPVLFFWSMVLLLIVALAVVALWSGRIWLVWTLAVVSLVVGVLGLFSIGFYFLVPGFLLLLTAVLFTLDLQRGGPPENRRLSEFVS